MQSSLYRWANRIEPHRMTGNKQADTLTGYDQFLLCIYSVSHPDAQLDHVAAFNYRNGGGLYTRGQISSRFKELEITRKVASTEAHQAFEPRNVFKAQLFWTSPPPLGVVGITRLDSHLKSLIPRKVMAAWVSVYEREVTTLEIRRFAYESRFLRATDASSSRLRKYSKPTSLG